MSTNKRGWQRRHGLVVVLALFIATLTATTSATTASASDQYDLMRLKWYQYLVGGTYDPLDPDIADKLTDAADKAEVHWSTMDTTPTRTSLWSDYPSSSPNQNITESYNRLEQMARSLKTQGSRLSGDPQLLSDIIGALDWLNVNWYNQSTAVPVGPQTANITWFPFEVGVPLALTNLTVLLYDDLSPTQIANYMGAISNFTGPNCSKNGYSVTLATYPSWARGANLAWSCQIQILTNVIVKNGAKIADAVPRTVSLFNTVLSGDGFYADGSVIQHAKNPYTGGYGLASLRFAEVVYLLADSPWEYTDPNLGNLYGWIYDSFQPMIYRGAFMDMTAGRNISRKPAVPNPETHIFDREHQVTQSYMSTLVLIAQFAPSADAAQFKGMLKGLVESDTYSPPLGMLSLYALSKVKLLIADPSVVPISDLSLHKTYGSMDRVVHQRPSYALGIAMHSSRIYNYESINQENLRGWYTAAGMTYLYTAQDTGTHSNHFWPTVDPYRLPGTTVDRAVRADSSYHDQVSAAPWVGGVTLAGEYGAAGMQLQDLSSPLTGKKSWFMFDKEFVALGAGVSDTSLNSVETTVENRMISGGETLTVNGVAKPSTIGWSETMSGVNSIQIADQNLGYYFPGGATVKGLRETRTGAYTHITQNNNPDPTPISRNYLSFWLDHGVAPTNASYAYVVLPNTSSAQLNAYAANPQIKVLRNDSDVQAVQEITSGAMGANFWTDVPTTVSMNGNSTYLSSNKKASIMVKDVGGELSVAVSDPTQLNSGTIQVTVNTPTAGVITQASNITVTQTYPQTVLTVDVSGKRGASSEVVLAKPLVLPPTADSYTYAAAPGSNYGTAAILGVKGQPDGNLNRNALFKFDLNELDGVAHATLRLYGYNASSSATTPLSVFEAANSSWTESGVTWTTQPTASSGAIGTGNFGGTAGYADIDITSYVQSKLTGDRALSLKVMDIANSSNVVLLNSKESASYKPELVIVPAPVALTPTEDVYVYEAAPATNFASDNHLAAKQMAGSSRWSYLKFDVSGVGMAASVKLRIYGNNTNDNTAVSLGAFATTSDSWTETGQTWSNRTSISGSVLATASVTQTAAYYELDVTEYALSQAAGDNILSLALKDTGSTTKFVLMDSKENSNPPQLVVTY